MLKNINFNVKVFQIFLSAIIEHEEDKKEIKEEIENIPIEEIEDIQFLEEQDEDGIIKKYIKSQVWNKFYTDNKTINEFKKIKNKRIKEQEKEQQRLENLRRQKEQEEELERIREQKIQAEEKRQADEERKKRQSIVDNFYIRIDEAESKEDLDRIKVQKRRNTGTAYLSYDGNREIEIEQNIAQNIFDSLKNKYNLLIEQEEEERNRIIEEREKIRQQEQERKEREEAKRKAQEDEERRLNEEIRRLEKEKEEEEEKERQVKLARAIETIKKLRERGRTIRGIEDYASRLRLDREERKRLQKIEEEKALEEYNKNLKRLNDLIEDGTYEDLEELKKYSFINRRNQGPTIRYDGQDFLIVDKETFKRLKEDIPFKIDKLEGDEEFRKKEVKRLLPKRREFFRKKFFDREVKEEVEKKRSLKDKLKPIVQNLRLKEQIEKERKAQEEKQEEERKKNNGTTRKNKTRRIY